jgi:prepilin-type N-terminal cleavage/methylation domain-containing protein
MRTIDGSRERGFTLMEMLVAVVIAAIVMLGVFRVFTSAQRTYEKGTENIDGQQNARAALNWLAKEIRSAKGFNVAQPGRVTILSDKTTRDQQRTFTLDAGDVDGDGDTSELLLTRAPDDDGTLGVFTDEIAVGIDSLAFIYRDGNGAITASRASIQEVEILVFAAGSGMRDQTGPGAVNERRISMSTRVKCRNLGMSVPTLGDVTPPSAPTGLSVVMGCGTATAQWTANPEPDVAGYYLSYSKGSSGSPYSGIDALQGASPIFVGNVTSYTLTGLSLSSTYYFNLQAVDAADNVSAFATEVSGTPSDATAPVTPTGLTGRVVGNSDVELLWNAVSDWDVAWYKVRYYDTANPTTSFIDSTQARSIVLTGLTQDAVYTCTVSAADWCGNESPESSPFSITMVACSKDTNFPNVPSTISVVPGDEFVQVTWSPVADPDVVGYQIYFQEQGTTQGSLLSVGNVSTYTVYGVTNGVTYELQVAAVDGCGHVGGYTGLTPATPQNCATNTSPPETPANLTAQDLGVGDKVRLSWTIAGQGDVLGYRVLWGLAANALTNSMDVGSNIFHTVSGLAPGTTYFFSVESYDVCGNYSVPASAVTATPSWGCVCPPTVHTTAPPSVAVVYGIAPWTATAQACSTAAITHVEFRLDGVTKYVDYTAPFEYGDFGAGWNTTQSADGPHQLVTVATDNNLCQAADTITVFVDNSGIGVSCAGIDPAASATVAGFYDNEFSVPVINQSAIDTYYMDAVVLEWNNPSVSVSLVTFDGNVAWYASPGPAAPGDTLKFLSQVIIAPTGTVQMGVVTTDNSGNVPPPLDAYSSSWDVEFFGAPIEPCGPFAIPMGSCVPDVVIQSVNSSNPYDVWGTPSLGDQYYTDRTYTLTYIPSEITESVLVRTPNNDKNKGDSHQLVLTVDRASTIWIAFDPRGTPPNWIGGSYTNTGLSIGVTDTGTSTLNLWKRNVSAGNVTLSGAKATGWGGGVATGYVAFVTCQ